MKRLSETRNYYRTANLMRKRSFDHVVILYSLLLKQRNLTILNTRIFFYRSIAILFIQNLVISSILNNNSLIKKEKEKESCEVKQTTLGFSNNFHERSITRVRLFTGRNLLLKERICRHSMYQFLANGNEVSSKQVITPFTHCSFLPRRVNRRERGKETENFPVIKVLRKRRRSKFASSRVNEARNSCQFA